MNFDANRLAKLAGLPVSETRTLTEASNRSMHDDASPVSDEAEHRFGKGQLAERKPYGGNRGDMIRGPGEDKRGHHHGDKAYVQEMDHPVDEMGHPVDEMGHPVDEMEHQDEYVEVSEEMIAEEIKKMRQERIEENQLRSVIRAEISSIVNGLKSAKSSAKRKSTRTTSFDGITKGFPGPGFR